MEENDHSGEIYHPGLKDSVNSSHRPGVCRLLVPDDCNFALRCTISNKVPWRLCDALSFGGRTSSSSSHLDNALMHLAENILIPAFERQYASAVL